MQTPKNYCNFGNFSVLIRFLGGKQVSSVTFDELFVFISRLFWGFCVVLVKHSSMISISTFKVTKCGEKEEDLTLKSEKNSSQATNTIAFVKRQVRLVHRYELIDFPCSLHSFDLADFLSAWLFSFKVRDNSHEKFQTANRCATRSPTVIRLTAIFANNSHRKRPRFIYAWHSKISNNFAVIVRRKMFLARYLIFCPDKSTEKCVHSPSIHHAISRQKLSINQSTRQSNDSER